MKQLALKRGFAVMLALLLVLAMVPMHTLTTSADAKKPTIAKTVKVKEGEQKSLKITKNGWKIKSVKSSSSKKSVATVKVKKKAVVVTGKKAGKATVTTTVNATNNKKTSTFKLKTKVTVSASDEPQADEQYSDDELYSNAVHDAVFIEDDEVLPLVNINKDDENVIWDGDKVLVTLLHKYPESYPAGEEIDLKWGNVWCVSAKEMCKWVQNNGEGVDNWTLRLHQVMGLPTSKEYTNVTALWVDADLLYRPANVSDPNAEMSAQYQPTGDEEFDKMFKEWFDSNIVWSYFDNALPWTRLGYTYDWANNGKEYGLSEFLIFSGAKAKVEYTYTLDEFVEYAKTFSE